MANPNLLGISTVIGVTTHVGVTSTFTSVLANGVDSGHLYKIVSIIAANTSTTNTGLTVNLNDSAAGSGTSQAICHNVVVPAASTLVILDKSTSYFVTENNSILTQANFAGNLDLSVVYEDISWGNHG